MPNKYSYSHVIAELGRTGVIDSAPGYAYTQNENAFDPRPHEDADDAYTLSVDPNEQEIDFQSPLQGPSHFGPLAQSTYLRPSYSTALVYPWEIPPSTSANEYVAPGKGMMYHNSPDEVGSLRSLSSLQTIVHDPRSQSRSSSRDQNDTTAIDDRDSYSVQSHYQVSSKISDAQGPLQATTSPYAWPEPCLLSDSEGRSSFYESNSTQPSAAHSSNLSHPTSDNTEPTPLSVHDQHFYAPDRNRPGESKQTLGRTALFTVNEGQITDFPLHSQPEDISTKREATSKATRRVHQENSHSYESDGAQRVQRMRDWRNWKNPVSNTQVSHVIQSTRLPPYPDEPRDIRRLDGVEMVEGTRLATQNIDGTEIPAVEAAVVNDLPTPPEASDGPGLTAPDVDRGHRLGLEHPVDRLRPASPPPPPNFNRDEVRRIAPRATNQGQNLAQKHFTEATKTAATGIKDHIDNIAHEFEQKLFEGRRGRDPKFNTFSEDDLQSSRGLPESTRLESSVEECWAQSDLGADTTPQRHISPSHDTTASQSSSKRDSPLGQPYIEPSHATEPNFGFDKEYLAEPEFEGDISSSRFEQILGLQQQQRQQAPHRPGKKGFGSVLKRLVPGQQGEDLSMSESKGTASAPSVCGNAVTRRSDTEPSSSSADRYSMISQSDADALPPPIRR